MRKVMLSVLFAGPQVVSIEPARILVGGDSNRWLNITRIEVIGGAEDPDSKVFMCEVCLNRDAQDEECHTANYTSWIVGTPPVLNVNGTSPGKVLLQ